MSTTDYVVDLLLLALILRQFSAKPLTARSLLLPACVLAAAGANYLRAFPTGGNDLWMDAALIAAGSVLGIASGLTTMVWTERGRIMVRAGDVAILIWTVGMGIALGFDVWAHTHAGSVALARFAGRHSISTANAYVVAFVLMAFAQVVLRAGLLEYRRVQLSLLASRVPAG